MITAWREAEWWERIIFTVFVGAIALFFVLAVPEMTKPQPQAVCADPRSVACLDARVDKCLALEKYTRAECIQLIGGQP